MRTGITHPEKVLWPSLGIRKIDYLQYLVGVSEAMLPHLYNRPMTMIRYPHGVSGTHFYQKNVPAGAPANIPTYWDRSGDKPIQYVLVNDLDTLIWTGNQSAIELHPAYTTITAPDTPTQLAIDLDPTVPGFEAVRDVSFAVKDALDQLALPSYPKTSGMTGVQIFVPIAHRYTFADTRVILTFLAQYVQARLPKLVTLARKIKDRGDRVYLDFVQHAPHKTLVAPYSARGSEAGTVSAPVTWDELARGCVPADFTVRTMPDRLQRVGDLFAPVAHPGILLDDILAWLKRRRSVLHR